MAVQPDQGVFITAAHVIDSYLQLNSHRADFELFVCLPREFADGQRTLLGHPVKYIGAAATLSDAALLVVDLVALNESEFETLWSCRVDLSRPQIGDECLALGWINQHGRDMALLASKGTISEIYPSGVHPTFRPFPCFQLDASLSSGMSGGPVLNARTGGQCGFVSSAMDTGDDTTTFGFISHLGTIAELQIDIEVDGRIEEVNLQRLFDNGLNSTGTAGLQLLRDQNSLTVVWI